MSQDDPDPKSRLPRLLTLEEASAWLDLPSRLVRDLVSYDFDGRKLTPESGSGSGTTPTWRFTREEIESFQEHLESSWPDHKREPPVFVARHLKIEAEGGCGLCRKQKPNYEIAHIVPWAKTQCHSPHNLIRLCLDCHRSFGADTKALEMAKGQLRARSRSIAFRTVAENRDRLQRVSKYLAIGGFLLSGVSLILALGGYQLWGRLHDQEADLKQGRSERAGLLEQLAQSRRETKSIRMSLKKSEDQLLSLQAERLLLESLDLEFSVEIRPAAPPASVLRPLGNKGAVLLVDLASDVRLSCPATEVKQEPFGADGVRKSGYYSLRASNDLRGQPLTRLKDFDALVFDYRRFLGAYRDARVERSVLIYVEIRVNARPFFRQEWKRSLNEGFPEELDSALRLDFDDDYSSAVGRLIESIE